MHLNGELAMIQARAAGLGRRVVANEGWLVGGFLADGPISPRRYLAMAEQQKRLQREFFALTQRLLTDAPLRPVA